MPTTLSFNPEYDLRIFIQALDRAIEEGAFPSGEPINHLIKRKLREFAESQGCFVSDYQQIYLRYGGRFWQDEESCSGPEMIHFARESLNLANSWTGVCIHASAKINCDKCSQGSFNLKETLDHHWLCEKCVAEGGVVTLINHEYLAPKEKCLEILTDRYGNVGYILETEKERWSFVCHHCQKTYLKNMPVGDYRIENESYCQNCVESLFYQCYACGQWHPMAKRQQCPWCERTFCPQHLNHHACDGLEEREAQTEHIYGKNDGEFIPKDRLIGVEIEAERDGDFGNEALREIPKACGIGHDGSLNDGDEITTPPVSGDEAEKIITEACTVLKEGHYQALKTCGLHVHLDAADFKNDPVKLCRLFRLEYALEPILYAMLPPSRGISRYCFPLSREYRFDQFKETKAPHIFDRRWYQTYDREEIRERKADKHDDTRYHGLNLHSIFYRGTIEFRHHCGTLDPHKILPWIGLLHQIVAYAVGPDYDDKMVCLLNHARGKAKFNLMVRLLKLNDKVVRYIVARVNKFHPNTNFSKMQLCADSTAL